MKKLLTNLIVPSAVLVGSLGAVGAVGVLNAGPAAATQAHVTMATKTWHGKVTKLDETMGTTHAFTFEGAHMTTYVVHYDAMTKFTMGTRSDIKVGGLISVTGTLKGKTITATSIDL